MFDESRTQRVKGTALTWRRCAVAWVVLLSLSVSPLATYLNLWRS